MIVYNITTKVRWDILEAWLDWQLEEQIPSILSTNCFDDYALYRLLEQEEEEGPTFVIQLFTTGVERYQQFVEEHAPALQAAAGEIWGDAFIAFRTLMESV